VKELKLPGYQLIKHKRSIRQPHNLWMRQKQQKVHMQTFSRAFGPIILPFFINIRCLSFLQIHLFWYITSLFLVCRFTHYRVYLVYFRVSKMSYIYKWSEYIFICICCACGELNPNVLNFFVRQWLQPLLGAFRIPKYI
jgi:hypothetical protein